MRYDKPFKTHEELIALLESKNLIINNKELAIEVLSSVSYQALTYNYKKTFGLSLIHI